ncbi:hypothetical protein VCR4J2_250412 [Vibrio coralliirubri]|nr:hypothetical protein VCR4J2_250412 [Vibrio coralliirubri]
MMSDRADWPQVYRHFKIKGTKIAEPINRDKYWFSLIRATQWKFLRPHK